MLKTCLVEGCKWKVHARGMCIGHYKLWHRGKRGKQLLRNVSGILPDHQPTCSIDGCKNVVRRKGMCDAHCRRWQKGERGELLARPFRIKAQDWPLKPRKAVTQPKSVRKERVDYGLSPAQKLAMLIEDMGGKCTKCGKSFPSFVYDFHHRDGSEKEFSPKKYVRSHGRTEFVLAEARKCDLVCVNCHRLIHFYQEWVSLDIQVKTEQIKIPFTIAKCKVDNCNLDAVALGYCSFHWRLAKDGKKITSVPLRVRKRINTGKCCVDGCDRNARTKNMCFAHYKRTLKNISGKELTKPFRGSAAKCSIDGCGRYAIAKGYCNAHYLRSTKGVDMFPPIAPRHEGLCVFVGCNHKASRAGGFGYCSKHYKAYARKILWEKIIESKGNKCEKCNEKFHYTVYDLHHREQKNKTFSIGGSIGRFSKNTILLEAEKCNLLCANCHRMEHFGNADNLHGIYGERSTVPQG